MNLADAADVLLRAYPALFHACHRRHVADPSGRKILSAHQASVLEHLDSVSATAMTKLAGHMGVTASTMSLTIDRLERGGFVRRRRDSSDGRRVLLTLTPRGARVREKQSVLDPDLVRAVLSRLSAEQRARAVEGLTLLAQAAEAQMNQRAENGDAQ